MRKAEFLEHFAGIKPEQEINMCQVPYKHKGSTYLEDSIRLTGSKEFIESVLSRVKDLLDYENGSTRLSTVFQPTTDRESGVLTDSWNCYLQVHQRGAEAQAMNMMFSGFSTK